MSIIIGNFWGTVGNASMLSLQGISDMIFVLDTGKGKPREGLNRVNPAGLASFTTTLSLCRQWYNMFRAIKMRDELFYVKTDSVRKDGPSHGMKDGRRRE